MRLIKKEKLAVKEAASIDKTKYILNGVMIEETEKGVKTTATDEHILAIVEGPTDDAKKYPAVPVLESFKNSNTKAVIPIEAVNKAVKSISKRNRLPLLDNVAVKLNDNEGLLCTTDLDNATPIVTRLIEGTYPAVDNVIPKGGTKFQISFSPEIVGKIAKIGKDFGAKSLTLEFTEPLSPVKVTGKNGDDVLTVVAMPMEGG